MISKPLFKQSIKANWGMWTAVTAATCFMLALIVVVTGGNSINNILSSLGDAFIKDSVRCETESAAMNYYYTAGISIDGYEAGADSINLPHFTENDLIDSVAEGISESTRNRLLENGESADEAEAAAAAAESFIRAFLAEYSACREYLAGEADKPAFAENFVSELLGGTMPERLLENGLTEQQISDYDFTSEKIKTISGRAIQKFRAQVSAEYPASVYSGLSAITLQHPDAIKEIIENLTVSFIAELPENAQDYMSDMQAFDLSQFLIGTIFFKIAGLLLPVIYIIMVSISLIAGQVDSGSMAYVVSTPIKRKAVTLTQMAFLVFSLFLMCLLTTATGLICLLIAGESSVSYFQMILLNITLFITLFAFAGICFLASAWFNRSKHAMAIGGGISMYFVVATIMGMFGAPEMPGLIRMDSMNIFNYTTITGLFDGASIFAGTTDFVPQLAVLFLIGLAGFIIGIFRFDKKDLPL